MIYQETYWCSIHQIISDDSYRGAIRRPVVEVGKAFIKAIFTGIVYKITGETIELDIDVALRKCMQYLIKDGKQNVIGGKIDKLLMFLGEMFLFKKFDLLQSIEADFEIIISSLELHKQQEISLSRIDTIDNQENSSGDQSIVQILDAIESRPNLEPNTTMTAQKGCNERQIIDYLSTIKRYRSQINFLSQIMKIPLPIFTTTNHRHYHQVKATLSFPCVYLNKSLLSFQAISKNRYYEQALSQVCRKILYSLYHSVPQLWRDFVSIKARKAIVS